MAAMFGRRYGSFSGGIDLPDEKQAALGAEGGVA
jgi:hypothetical protein